MRLVAEQAECVLLLHQGELVAEGATRQIFARPELLAQVSAGPAPVTRLSQELRPWGMKGESLTVEAFYREYVALLSAQGGGG
jgi:ABC-type glutathione transport system ATPase component